jgi:hypothetical protein
MSVRMVPGTYRSYGGRVSARVVMSVTFSSLPFCHVLLLCSFMLFRCTEGCFDGVRVSEIPDRGRVSEMCFLGCLTCFFSLFNVFFSLFNVISLLLFLHFVSLSSTFCSHSHTTNINSLTVTLTRMTVRKIRRRRPMKHTAVNTRIHNSLYSLTTHTSYH